jgi:hypothetical protein
MPGRRSLVRPLLAVSAVSLAACGSSALPAQITRDPAATPPPTAAPSASPAAPTGSGSPAGAVAPAAATPRVMPNGRPACGNVAMRASPDCT